MHFLPTGAVRACCWSSHDLGDVRRDHLADVWAGARRRELVRRLASDDLSLGCQGCAAQVAVEGRPGSPPGYFDEWEAEVAHLPEAGLMPRRMEFEISITCNLQCVQCSGANSSSIRLHREKRPPLPQAYGDRFFEELRPFLPHLVEASFVGGEPFLGPENFRIWDDLRTLAPHVRTLICTNGTQWNDRVVRVLEDLDARITVSLDGASAAVFEAMRPGASFERVLTNLDRFCEHHRRRGHVVQINHCLMPGNAHELPELLLLAEERDALVHVVVVRSPKQHSLQFLPREDLARLLAGWEARADEVRPHLRRNRFAWDQELARVGRWLAEGDGEAAREELTTTVLMFPRRGERSPAARREESVAELVGASPDGVVHRLVVDRHDRLCEVPVAFAAEIGVTPADLLGRPAASLLELIERWDVTGEAPDRVDATMRLRGRDARVVFVPVRDAEGQADEAWMLFSFDR
jgi:MoaA/NifB/PqqE/SkfB family radical SAM enzyme